MDDIVKVSDPPCHVCGQPSRWVYMPAHNGDESLDWCCDEHVPRECLFCNCDDDGNPNPKPWMPCVEWWPINPKDNGQPN